MDALALRGEEGRGWLRKAPGSCQPSVDPVMSEWGNPALRIAASLSTEYIGGEERTWGSETSQYPEEKKTTCDSASSGERTRNSLNQSGLLDWGRGTEHNGRSRINGKVWKYLP